MKKLALVLLSVCLLATAAFAEGKQEGASGVKVMKAGHGLPEDTSLGEGFTKFKELVEAKSNGTIKSRDLCKRPPGR